MDWNKCGNILIQRMGIIWCKNRDWKRAQKQLWKSSYLSLNKTRSISISIKIIGSRWGKKISKIPVGIEGWTGYQNQITLKNNFILNSIISIYNSNIPTFSIII